MRKKKAGAERAEGCGNAPIRATIAASHPGAWPTCWGSMKRQRLVRAQKAELTRMGSDAEWQKTSRPRDVRLLQTTESSEAKLIGASHVRVFRQGTVSTAGALPYSLSEVKRLLRGCKRFANAELERSQAGELLG